jgi:hypothetical protein
VPEAQPETAERLPLVRRLDWGTVAGVALVVLAFAVPLRGLLRTEGGPMEEGFMLVFPERVLHGAIPNKDFLHLYGPGSLWVLAAVFKLFGVSLAAERLVALVQQAAVVFAVFTIVRHWGRALATVAGVASVLLITTPIGLVALAWVGALGPLLWGLYLLWLAARRGEPDRAGARLAVAGGVLLAIALLFRPDVVIAVALGGAVLWPVLPAPLRTRALAGLGVGLLPYVLHVALAGPGNAFRGMVLDPVFHLRAGRHLPVPPSSKDLDGFLQKIAELDVIRWPAPMNTPQQIHAWFLGLVAATVFLAAVAVVAVRRDRVRWNARLLAVGAAVSVGILPQAIQRPDSTHLAWVSCITLCLLPAAFAEVTRGWRPAWRRLAGPVTGAVVLVGLLVLVIPFFTLRRYADYSLQSINRSRSAHAIRNDGRVFYYGRADVAAIFPALIRDVERLTQPGDRLFVGPSDLTRTAYNDAFVYYLFPDLVPATYYIEMDPGVADKPGSGLPGDLASADVAVLTPIWDHWVEPNDSVKHGSTATARVLARDFCKVRDYDGLYELYRRCRGDGR